MALFRLGVMPASQGKTWRVFLATVAITATAAWLAITWQRQATTVPAVDQPRLAPGVVLRDVSFYSQALRREMQYRVFMPQEALGKELPVVYLLHGGGGTYRDWSNYSDVAQFAAKGLLLVMPEGDNSYYVNSVERPQDRYDDYIVDDLQADVAARFFSGRSILELKASQDTNKNAAQVGWRAIAGVSMGGFGAINLALRHPERFQFVGALSGAIDAPRRAFSLRRRNQSKHFRELFGAEGSETRSGNNPFVLAKRTELKAGPYFYLTCGQQEGLLAPNQEFADLLTQLKIEHEFHEVPGGHTWDQWNEQVPEMFEALLQRAPMPGKSQR